MSEEEKPSEPEKEAKEAQEPASRGRRVKVSTLLNWCFGAALILIGVFGYFYLKQRAPLPVGAMMDTGRTVLNIPPPFRRTIYGPASSPLNRPLMVAVHTLTGEIYVADTSNNQIQVFARDGMWLRRFGRTGRGPVQFDFPYSLALRGERLYVADRENSRIQILTREGRYLGQIPDPQKNPGLGLVPLGLHAGRDGNLYVTTKDNHVLVFDQNDRLIREFGKGGYLPGQFSYPNAIVLDRRGRLWVSDSNNARVQIISADGQRVERIISGFAVPQGMAIDDNGRVWVADPLQHKLYAYGEDGQFLWEVGDRGEGDGQFNFPSGVATYGSEFFVVDRGNNRVVIFGF